MPKSDNSFKDMLSFLHYRLTRPKGTFVFNGREYKYFSHFYNCTWRNERVIEVPIFSDLMERFKGKRILEVGNVMSHYTSMKHDVVDKYEKSKGVVNSDIVDFRPKEKYDLIITISTLEHVGWDETPKDPGKVLRAVENLKSLVAPGGLLAASVPWGYNKELDKLIEKGKLGFPEEHFLKRLTKSNIWEETGLKEVAKTEFGRPYSMGNGLWIGFFRK